MPTYTVNQAGVAHARELIDARQYVLRSEWGRVQPAAEDENAFLTRHSWAEYAAWHLGLTEGADGRDQGPVRVRLRRLPPGAPHGSDRLPLPGRRVGTQGDRARRARPPPAPGRGEGLTAGPGSVPAITQQAYLDTDGHLEDSGARG